MQALGEDVSDARLCKVVADFDKDGSGTLELDDFVAMMKQHTAWVQALDKKRDRPNWFKSVTKERTWVDLHDPAAAAHNKLVQKSMALLQDEGLSLAAVTEAFQVFDEDESGAVSASEFRGGVEALGIGLSDSEVGS